MLAATAPEPSSEKRRGRTSTVQPLPNPCTCSNDNSARTEQLQCLSSRYAVRGPVASVFAALIWSANHD